MDMEHNETPVKEVYYEDGYCRRRGVDNSARTLGIIGTVAGGVALANAWHRGNLFGGGYNNGMPENININTLGGAAAGAVPTAFQAWERSCDDAIALTNELWRLQLASERQLYAIRDVDVNEKFQLYKSQIDADFGLYKSQRDADDAIIAKHNQDVFGLYKEQRDNFDKVTAELTALKTKVAVDEAIRPYQDKLIQCEIEKAFTASINYTDRKTCRMISGQVVLPSTPTVTGYGSYNPCACPAQAAASAGA